MATSLFSTNFKINGVVDTNKSAMENINNLSNACGVWTTFDINTGKWSVTINQAGAPAYSFNDSNILGAITVSGTGLKEYYNRVEVGFPHKDLNDQRDYIGFAIPPEDLFENEPENTLTIEFDCVNEPIQAGLLGARELKQSRVDKIIKFSTDFSKLGIKAGDLISVTNAALGFTNKMFRVVTVSEIDGEGGEIVLEITALEYDPNVYNTDGLIRTQRTRLNGIKSRGVNDTIKELDKVGNTVNSKSSAFVDVFATQALSVTPRPWPPVGYNPSYPNNQVFIGATIYSLANKTLPYTGWYKVRYYCNWGGNNTGSNKGDDNVIKTTTMLLSLNGQILSGETSGGLASSTGGTSSVFEDHFVEYIFNAQAGSTLQYGVAFYVYTTGSTVLSPISFLVSETNFIQEPLRSV